MIKKLFKNIAVRFKQLRGDPHYISMGMAIGVFIGVTPTFPFHTTLAIALATLLRGSRPAAALGVWFGNPVTMPIFYIGSYKAGMMLFGQALPSIALEQPALADLLTLGLDVALAMVAGGALIGIPPSIAAYFITHIMVTKINSRQDRQKTMQENADKLP
ncbi:MAG: DUF2062 domain-containing protein [Pseudomonadota bacterium]